MTAEVIRPQKGRQEQFLASAADIAIFGGAAGSGKSYGILLEPLRHVNNKDFGAVIFRRESVQITKEGGLWDTAMKLYPTIGGAPVQHPRMLFKFSTGSRVSFDHLNQESTVLDHQGAQYPFIGYDELTHFCLSPEHDVLTESGWKPIAQVKIGERVASLNNDRQIVLSLVTDTPEFDYDGDLIEWNQRNGVSFRVTPSHRLVIDRQDDGCSWGFMTAERAEGTHQNIPRSGIWSGELNIQSIKLDLPSGRGVGSNANIAHQVNCSDWLEFLGWYMSEGSAFLAAKSQGGTSPCVSIRQTKPCPSLDALMQRLPWRSRPDGDGGYRIFSRQLFDVLAHMGNAHQKRIPRWIMRLPHSQQRIFLDAFIAGDGSPTPSGGWSIGLCNEKLIDDIQEMAFYCGLTGTKGYSKRVTGGKDFDSWRVTISSRKTTMVKPSDSQRAKYTGKVHCLTVEKNGTFLIRRNGRTCWTGNSRNQFFYMLSRNRSTCGVRPYIRATTNPDAESWVAEFIAWWIGEDGYPIQERSGKLRWFARVNDTLYWADTPEQLAEDHGVEVSDCKSVTFIAASIHDNPALMKADPGYMANLKALSRVERERLLYGNWKIKPAAGEYFSRSDVEVIDNPPAEIDIREIARAWDLAATEPNEQNPDPDWTAGVKMARLWDGKLCIMDVQHFRKKAAEVRSRVLNCATHDGHNVRISIPEDPGQAGKEQAASYVKELSGYSVFPRRAQAGKVQRAEPFAAQWQAGNVVVVRASWNDALFAELERFPEGGHDDIVDACSDAFASLPSPVIEQADACGEMESANADW